MTKKQILLHEPDEAKRSAIEKLCKSLQVHVKYLTPKDLNKTVHVLAGISGAKVMADAKHEQAPVFFMMPEIMIFSGLSDGELDTFLEAYRQAGIAPIGLKAIVTPYNVGWSLYELVAELTKERNSFA